MSTKISLIIPTRCDEGRSKLSRLLITLKSLEAQTLDNSFFEIVVVDNGSTISIENEIEALEIKANVTFVKSDKTGMGHGFNLGAERATGEFLFLGIDDNVLAPMTLEYHLRNARHGQISVGQERYIIHARIFSDILEGTLDFSEDAVNTFGSGTNLGMEDWFFPMHLLDRNPDILEFLSTVPTEIKDIQTTFLRNDLADMHWLGMRVGNHVLAKNDFWSVGGFDTQLDDWDSWYSDLDFGIRASQRGLAFQYLPQAKTFNLTHHKTISVPNALRAHQYLVSKHAYLEVGLVPMYFGFGQDYLVSQYAQQVKRIAELTSARTRLKGGLDG